MSLCVCAHARVGACARVWVCICARKQLCRTRNAHFTLWQLPLGNEVRLGSSSFAQCLLKKIDDAKDHGGWDGCKGLVEKMDTAMV